VPAAEGRRHLVKADEFVRAATASFQAGRFIASGLESVHAGISAADAITAHKRSEVSSAPDHLQVVHLLRDSQARAKTMLDQATRFVVWSRSIVEEPTART